MARPRGLSVVLLVPAVLACLAVLAAGSVGWISVRQSRAAADDLAAQLLARVNASVRQRVESYVNVIERRSSLNADLIAAGVLDPTDLRSWRPHLVSQMTATPELSGLAWGTQANGHTVWTVRYPGEDALEYAILDDATDGRIIEFGVEPGGELSAQPRGTYQYDPRPRPWYRAGAEAHESGERARWSAVYTWVRADAVNGNGGAPGISYARPITTESGDLLGVIDTEMELRSLSAFLASLRVGQTGWAMIVSAKGELLASSITQPLVVDGQPVIAAEAEDAGTRLTAGQLLGETTVAAEAASEFLTPRRVDIGGEPTWVGAARLTHEDGLDWLIIAAMPEADLVGPIESARQSAMLAAAVAALVAALIGIGIGLVAVRPVLRLRDHARTIGSGDLEAELTLGGVRELAELSADINAMQADLRDHLRLRQSLQLAMDVQQNLLPDGPPTIPGIDIAGESTYCDETGGDYYDFLDLLDVEGHTVGVALGDVMGHGVAAALLMASARAVLRTRATEPGSLAELLTHVNTQLHNDTGGSRFMTMMLMTLDRTARELRWSSAGQDPPFVYDPTKDRFIDLEAEGFPLAVIDTPDYTEHRLGDLPTGLVIVIGTDGLWESRNPEGEQFGKDRVRDIISRNAERPSAELLDLLKNELLGFCGRARPEDDITLVVLRITESDTAQES